MHGSYNNNKIFYIIFLAYIQHDDDVPLEKLEHVYWERWKIFNRSIAWDLHVIPVCAYSGQKITVGWGSPVSRQSANEGDKFCINAPAVFTPSLKELFLVLVSVSGWVDPSAICSRKDYVNEKWDYREPNPRSFGL
jgi:hypothetical protein